MGVWGFAAAAHADAADSIVAGSSGSARWTIPIEVPPGPGGLEPTLALVYSSSAGDGPFGVGWQLPLGEISCSVRHGVPAYINPGGANCPQFELDGELLNPGNGRYHTFVESFQRILDKGYIGWEVTSPDGTIRRYGLNQNSRIVAPSGNVARWLLSSIMDPFGNEIEFDYDGNPSTPAFELPMIGNRNNGHTYIKRIRYGPNSERVVEVEYESRTDVIHDYAGGVERLIAYRATEIRVESSGSTHSRYQLGYDLDDLHETPTAAQYSTSRSRLSYSIRFGAGCDSTTPLADCTPANGLALPAQEFRYTDPDDVSGTQWDSAAFEGPPVSFDEQFYWPSHQSAVRIGDVDGDGLVDIVKADQSTGERRVWINKKTRWELDQGWSNALAGLQFGAPRVNVTVYNYPTSIIEYPYWTKVCAADYVDQQSGVFFADPTFHNGLNIQFPYRAQGSAYPPQLYVQLGGNFHLVDLDGDGRADLVMSMRLSGIHRTHDCTTGAELTPWQMIEPNGREVRVVFRNTGTGWVPDTNLAQGLPLFGMVATESDWVGYANGGINYDPCTGLISRDFNWNRDDGAFEVRPCINYADFAPAFADLNGDGRADVIAAAPSAPSPTMVISNSPRPWELSDNFAVSTTASRAWLWQPGTGWVRDASFDLPFHHAHITFVGDTSGPDQSFVGHSWASTGDAGVRIVDRNRDGLADVTWVDPYQDTGQDWCRFSGHYCPPPQPAGFPQAPRGVLLNRGAGGGQPYSAWCSSQPIAGVTRCSSESGAARFELPAAQRFAEIGFEQGGVYFTESAGAELGDVNGDGWLDLIRASGSNYGEDPPREIFLFSRGGPTAWVADSRFTPPTDLGFVLTWWEGAKRPSDGRLLDLDGDGALDFSHGFTGAYLGPDFYARSWIGRRGLSDLLREVRTGRGGTIQIAYDTGPRRRDVALEASAAGHAGDPAIGEPLGLIGEAHPTPAPVVASVTVEGLNRVPSTTRYRYADRRWDRARRVGLGWRLVEKTQPDGSVVESFFYQKHGRAGRLSERILWDQNKPVHWSEEVWAVVPPSQADDIPGAWPDATSAEVSHLGRLVSRASRNEYGNSLGQITGAEQEETFEYDDDYGYNFAKEVHTVRPSTDTIRFLEPATANTNDWIIGLVRERRDEDQRGSGWMSHSTFEYTNEGRLWKEGRQRWRGDVTQPADDLTQYFYDDFGNLRQRIDANGHSTGFGYDSTGSVLTSRTDPAVVQGNPGRITIFTPHPVFGVPFAVNPGYRDVPRVQMTLDAFGRVVETWQIPRDSLGEGEPALVSATNFMDAAWPPYVEQFDYTTADDAIRTAVADDGFGGVWKTIRDAGTTGPGGTGGPRYMGSATVHDPAQRMSRTTYDLPCGSDPWCTSITGGQSPAVVTTADALGRPTQVVDTARGSSLFHYASSHELIAEGDTRSSHPVDVVWSQNAKGDLVRRSFDGDRVVAVEECTNSDPDRTSLTNATCASTDGPNRTLYGYHASGQLEIVHDPIGAGAQWGDPHHQLRYHFDTAGFVIALDDPDAGHSQTYYDPVGNVVGTVNARNQLRATMYDALDRPTKIATPEGNIAFWYRAEELQPSQESGPLYTKIFTYDGFGRVAFESLQGWGANHTSYDLQGRQTSISPSGLGGATTIRYEYTGALLTGICSTAGSAASCSDASATPILSDVGYDGLGRRKSARLAGGLRTWSYEDEAGDANSTRDLIGDHFVGASTFTQEYGSRDPLGNLLSWSITTTGQSGLNASGTYRYDARNRIASRTRTADSQAPVEEDFRYDALGNLITHGGAAQVFAHPTKPHALTSRGTNTYDYDGSGNLVRAGGRHFTFDSADRLVCVGSGAGGCDVLRVVYDAAGARVYEKAGAIERGYHGPDHVQTRAGGTKEVRFDVRAFGELVAYTIQTSAPASAASPPGDAFEVPPWWVGLIPLAALAGCLTLAIRAGLLVGVARRPGYAGISGVLIVSLAIPYPAPAWGRSQVTNRYTRWVLADPIGSGVAVLDETGLLLHQTRFAPFGRAEAGEYHAPGAASEPQQRRTFAGHAEQQETGLDYMNARWMDPETGMFLSVDLVVRDIANPQSLNTYSYAENNPIAFNDPTGSCIPVTPCDGKWYGQLPEGAPVPGYAQVLNPGYLSESGVSPGMYAGDIGHVMAGDSVPGGLFDILFPATPSPGIWAANEGQSPDGRWIGGSQQQMQSTVDAGQGVLGAIARFGGLMGWDLALAFVGNVGNLYGMTRGLVTALAGVAALNPAMIGKGVSQFGWALVPRYGWWSGPGWGKPNLDANNGSWYGPYSSQSVIEYATYRHDYNFKNPGSDAQLIRDVWSRHDLGPYGQVYRVGLTALFGTGIALGFDD